MNFKFPIRIHCWGGLGSQLFALALAYDLHAKFPSRRIIVFCHSSGVTQRPPEIYGMLDFVKCVEIKDFDENEAWSARKNEKAKLSITKTFHIFLKNYVFAFLESIGFLSKSNSDLEYTKVKPWVVSFRGHYTHRILNLDFLSYVYGIFSNSEGISVNFLEVDSLREYVAIHFRLGDLLILKNKQNVSVDRIVACLNLVQPGKVNFNCLVFSDSPSDAKELLKNISGFEIRVFDFDSKLVLYFASLAKIFVGTNSKLSLWIAYFIALQNENARIFLPQGFESQVLNNISNLNLYSQIEFY